jgi:hypothetical protein
MSAHKCVLMRCVLAVSSHVCSRQVCPQFCPQGRNTPQDETVEPPARHPAVCGSTRRQRWNVTSPCPIASSFLLHIKPDQASLLPSTSSPLNLNIWRGPDKSKPGNDAVASKLILSVRKNIIHNLGQLMEPEDSNLNDKSLPMEQQYKYQ